MLVEFDLKIIDLLVDEAVLSMEVVGLALFKSCLIEQQNMKLLPGVAIYGKMAVVGYNVTGILVSCSVYSKCTENTA